MRLKEQGSPGYDEDIQCCQYITSDGRRCAVGVLLPMDYLYEHINDFAGGVCELFDDHPYARKLIEKEYGPIDVGFMKALQSAHDQAATDEAPYAESFLDHFREQLKHLETNHGIDTEKLI